jgi:hypothetical protein
LGDQPIKFVFLATEHPYNLAIGRGFRSFVHTSESGLTDRHLTHVSAVDKYLPVSSGAPRSSYAHQSEPVAQAITECLVGFLSEDVWPMHSSTTTRSIRLMT